MTTSHLADGDYFTDAAITQHPYDYWDELRRQGPVVREPHHGVMAVTGYQEVQAAFKDVEAFSAVNAIGGPFPPLPFTPNGDDISELITAHRHEFPIFEHMVVMDPPEHGKARSLLSRLLTPRRLRRTRNTSGVSPTGSSTSFLPMGGASSSARTESLSRHWQSPISSACPTRIALRFATTSGLDGLTAAVSAG